MAVRSKFMPAFVLPRQRSLRLLVVCAAAGMAVLQTRPALPDTTWFYPWPLLALAALWCPRGQAWQRLLAWFLAALAAFSGGFLYAAWRADLRLQDRLELAWQGRDVAVLARVVGLPEKTPQGARLILEIERSFTPGAGLPHRAQVFLPERAGPVPAGTCIRATLRLHRPHASLNPGLPDYTAWLFERGIRAQGVVVAAPEVSGECVASPLAWVDALRLRIRDRLWALLPDAPYAGIVAGLAVGDQQAIRDAQWALFRVTGITHLISISGLHITLLSGLVYALALAGWRRIPWLALRFPARRAAVLLAMAMALFYTALAGFGVPAQRTLFMVSAVGAATWLGWQVSPSRVLAAALACVLLIDPWASLAPGFWLSFTAVAALLYTGAGRLAPLPVAWGWVATQWVATVALLPPLLAWFHAVSLVSPLANAFAIPLVSFVMVPLILTSALLPVEWPVLVAHYLIGWLMRGLDWLATWPMPIWPRPAADGMALALGMIGVLWLLMPRGVPRRWLGAVLLLPLLWPTTRGIAPGEARVRVLDVGQGLSVLVQTAAHNLLYDTGPRYRSGGNAGERVVVPMLQALGVERLDGLVLSHRDGDHDGGTPPVVVAFRPPWTVTGEPGSTRAYTPCEAGQTWLWDGVRFEVLHPPAVYHENPYFSGNDRSCVLKVVAGGQSLLLTGDIGRLGELELIERQAARLPGTVVVVPHHGSAGSSMPAFVDAAAPRWAVFSAGAGNPFGHPRPEVITRYRQAGAAILRTDHDGEIELSLGEGGVHAVSAGRRLKRYWHAA